MATLVKINAPLDRDFLELLISGEKASDAYATLEVNLSGPNANAVFTHVLINKDWNPPVFAKVTLASPLQGVPLSNYISLPIVVHEGEGPEFLGNSKFLCMVDKKEKIPLSLTSEGVTPFPSDAFVPLRECINSEGLGTNHIGNSLIGYDFAEHKILATVPNVKAYYSGALHSLSETLTEEQFNSVEYIVYDVQC